MAGSSFPVLDFVGLEHLHSASPSGQQEALASLCQRVFDKPGASPCGTCFIQRLETKSPFLVYESRPAMLQSGRQTG